MVRFKRKRLAILPLVLFAGVFHDFCKVKFKNVHFFDVCPAYNVCAFQRPSGNLAYFPNKAFTVQTASFYSSIVASVVCASGNRQYQVCFFL